jgi:hypothetical protein
MDIAVWLGCAGSVIAVLLVDALWAVSLELMRKQAM